MSPTARAAPRAGRIGPPSSPVTTTRSSATSSRGGVVHGRPNGRWKPPVYDASGPGDPRARRRWCDTDLIVPSRRFRAACRDSRLTQECLTPDPPAHNGKIQRGFRSRKEACVWPQSRRSFDDARTTLGRGIQPHHEHPPHPALNSPSPAQFRAPPSLHVA